jgi:hypothetical protein
MEQLVALNGGDLPGADPHYRQQLVQEFFFHLVGAIEVLAQLVSEVRGFGLDIDRASIRSVRGRLPTGDPLKTALDGLYAEVRGNPLPADPYTDAGYVFRIWNYRHQVTHRRRQPFQLNIEIGTAIDSGPGLRGRWREWRYRRNPDPSLEAPGRSAHFILDPRDALEVPNASIHAVPAELNRMLDLISMGCEQALHDV